MGRRDNHSKFHLPTQAEVEKYPEGKAALIVSLDRKMSDEVASECVQCAVNLRKAGRRVVGVDLCGDPLVSLRLTLIL